MDRDSEIQKLREQRDRASEKVKELWEGKEGQGIREKRRVLEEKLDEEQKRKKARMEQAEEREKMGGKRKEELIKMIYTLNRRVGTKQIKIDKEKLHIQMIKSKIKSIDEDKNHLESEFTNTHREYLKYEDTIYNDCQSLSLIESKDLDCTQATRNVESALSSKDELTSILREKKNLKFELKRRIEHLKYEMRDVRSI